MKIKKYSDLPDRMEKTELTSLFEDALNKYSCRKISKAEFLEFLSELTARQVMSYELLAENVRSRVDTVISDIWNVNNYDEADIILSIVINLGLQGCYKKIKDSLALSEEIDEHILKEIRETIDENGDDISNPYRSLEKEFS